MLQFEILNMGREGNLRFQKYGMVLLTLITMSVCGQVFDHHYIQQPIKYMTLTHGVATVVCCDSYNICRNHTNSHKEVYTGQRNRMQPH